MRQPGSPRSPGTAEETLRRMLAQQRQGRLADLPKLTGLDPAAVRKRLSIMRHDGSAAWSSVFVPAKAGRPIETLSFVKLRDPSCPGLRAFETYCHDDRSIAAAALITGNFDYVLTGYFPDVASARCWLRGLSLRPDVAKVQQKFVQTRFGHALAGAPWI